MRVASGSSPETRQCSYTRLCHPRPDPESPNALNTPILAWPHPKQNAIPRPDREIHATCANQQNSLTAPQPQQSRKASSNPHATPLHSPGLDPGPTRKRSAAQPMRVASGSGPETRQCSYTRLCHPGLIRDHPAKPDNGIVIWRGLTQHKTPSSGLTGGSIAAARLPLLRRVRCALV